MNRRDLLRLGAAAVVIPTAEYVRKFFPVGIDLRKPVRTLPYCYSDKSWCIPDIVDGVLTVEYAPAFVAGLGAGTYYANVTIVDSSQFSPVSVPVNLHLVHHS